MSNKTKAKGKRVPVEEAPQQEQKRPLLKALPKEMTQPETINLPLNKVQVAQLTRAREMIAAAQERQRVVVEGILAANGYENGEALRVDEMDEGFVLVVANAK